VILTVAVADFELSAALTALTVTGLGDGSDDGAV
jgi:hypothetical protein